jgi:hypothetical protein
MKNGNRDNEGRNNSGVFVNGQQRKFYLIGRSFKIGNIIGTLVLVLLIGKSLLGV